MTPIRRAVLVLVIGCVAPLRLQAQSNELSAGFTYQGRLTWNREFADGEFDFRFSLWDDENGGESKGNPHVSEDVVVSSGLFTTSVDFGVEVFDGSKGWLRIEVKPSGPGGDYTTLSPRQEITATPYALQTRGLFVNQDKNVGIGTLDPDYKLHVQHDAGHAIVGEALSTTAQNFGVWGRSDGDDGRGVYGYALNSSGMNYGVYGRTDSADDGRGVYGLHWSSNGIGPGVLGQSNSESAYAIGVHGLISSSTPGGYSAGVRGENRGTAGSGIGVYGSHAGAGWGVYGEAANSGGYGVFGRNDATGSSGVYGQGDQASSHGVHGKSSLGVGVYGLHSTTELANPGVLGETKSTVTGAAGVVGRALAGSGDTIGVFGKSASDDDGIGVHGEADINTGIGVYGTGFTGVRGVAMSPDDAVGVYGDAPQGAGTSYGVYAISKSPDGIALYSENDDNGYALYSFGRCRIVGELVVSGNKEFCIDHPLDPANKYLSHYCEEGPEPRNVYRGRAQLDASGAAVVELPEYFHAINRDCEYLLTAIGAPMPNLHVAEEVANGRFRIAGGEPTKSVSWTVTGIRNDPWVRTHGAPVVTEKRSHERGKYLHPELYGQPRESRMHRRNADKVANGATPSGE